MSTHDELAATIAKLMAPAKGILAADESIPTITKRFAALKIESTEESRRAYRSMLFTTPGIEEYVAGMILFEESLGQNADDGTPLVDVLSRRGMLTGIKVDKGTVALPGAPGDLVTQGLDGLGERLDAYKARGARFAKWREVYGITDRNPTPLGIEANAEVLARYAGICQAHGIVPIVEPEVLIDGDHTQERCHEVCEAVLHAVFSALHRHRVSLEGMVLKPNMVLPGKDRSGRFATPRPRRRADDQFPVRRPGLGRGDRELERDERAGPQRALGAVVLLCARLAGRRDAHLGRSHGKCARGPECFPPAREDEQPRAVRQMDRGPGEGCLIPPSKNSVSFRGTRDEETAFHKLLISDESRFLALLGMTLPH